MLKTLLTEPQHYVAEDMVNTITDDSNDIYLVTHFRQFVKVMIPYLRRVMPTQYEQYKRNYKNHKKGDAKLDKIIAGEWPKRTDTSMYKTTTWYIRAYNIVDMQGSTRIYHYLRIKNTYFVNAEYRLGNSTPITNALLKYIELEEHDNLLIPPTCIAPGTSDDQLTIDMHNALMGGVVAVNNMFKGVVLRSEKVIDLCSAYPSIILKERLPDPDTVQVYEGYKPADVDHYNFYVVTGGYYRFLASPNHLPVYQSRIAEKDDPPFGEPYLMPSSLDELACLSETDWDIIHTSGLYEVLEQGQIVRTYQYKLVKPDPNYNNAYQGALKWYNLKSTSTDTGLKAYAKYRSQRLCGELQRANMSLCMDLYGHKVTSNPAERYRNCVVGAYILALTRRRIVDTMLKCEKVVFSTVDSIGFLGKCPIDNLKHQLGEFDIAYEYKWNIHMAINQSIGLLTNGKIHTRHGGETLQVEDITLAQVLSGTVNTVDYKQEVAPNGDIHYKKEIHPWTTANSILNSNRQLILKLTA